MNRRAMTVSTGLIALVLLCLTALASQGGDGPTQKEPVVGKAGPKAKLGLISKGRRLRALLNDSLDMKDFQGPMTLGEALAKVQKNLNAEYKQVEVLPILVDSEAFKEEFPDAPEILDTQVVFPRFSQKMSV